VSCSSNSFGTVNDTHHLLRKENNMALTDPRVANRISAMEAAPRKEIPLTISNLESEVDRLENLIERAVERYAPVSHSLPPEEADNKVRSNDFSSTVASALDNLNNRLIRVANRVECFIDACEL
jgi:nucleotidyltransferase/DNA polymerase involved in DNA repair